MNYYFEASSVAYSIQLILKLSIILLVSNDVNEIVTTYHAIISNLRLIKIRELL